MIYLLARGTFQPALTIILSAGILVFVAGLFARRRMSSSALLCWEFSLAVVATVFISYHCLGYDLSLLFLPIAILIAEPQYRAGFRTWPYGLISLGIAGLFCSPLYLFLIQRGNRLAGMGGSCWFS